MAISKKRSPKVDTDNMDRVIQQIYTDLNEIIDSVNQGDTSEGKGSHTGKSGDIRIIKRSNNVYHLQAKTDEGWVYGAMVEETEDDD